jgi:hypothetical protein
VEGVGSGGVPAAGPATCFVDTGLSTASCVTVALVDVDLGHEQSLKGIGGKQEQRKDQGRSTCASRGERSNNRRIIPLALARTARHDHAARSQTTGLRPRRRLNPEPVRAQQGRAPFRRGCLPVAQRGSRHRLATVYRVLTVDRPDFDAPSFRVGQGRVRAEPGASPRPSGLHQLRRVENSSMRKSNGDRSRSRRWGFAIREHALYLYAECVKKNCPHRHS